MADWISIPAVLLWRSKFPERQVPPANGGIQYRRLYPHIHTQCTPNMTSSTGVEVCVWLSSIMPIHCRVFSTGVVEVWYLPQPVFRGSTHYSAHLQPPQGMVSGLHLENLLFTEAPRGARVYQAPPPQSTPAFYLKQGSSGLPSLSPCFSSHLRFSPVSTGLGFVGEAIRWS